MAPHFLYDYTYSRMTHCATWNIWEVPCQSHSSFRLLKNRSTINSSQGIWRDEFIEDKERGQSTNEAGSVSAANSEMHVRRGVMTAARRETIPDTVLHTAPFFSILLRGEPYRLPEHFGSRFCMLTVNLHSDGDSLFRNFPKERAKIFSHVAFLD
jgi:hypothetical protein